MLPALGASYHAHYNHLLQTELRITRAQKQALALSWGSAVLTTGYHDFICGVAVCMPMSSHRVVVQPRFVRLSLGQAQQHPRHQQPSLVNTASPRPARLGCGALGP